MLSSEPSGRRNGKRDPVDAVARLDDVEQPLRIVGRRGGTIEVLVDEIEHAAGMGHAVTSSTTSKLNLKTRPSNSPCALHAALASDHLGHSVLQLQRAGRVVAGGEAHRRPERDPDAVPAQSQQLAPLERAAPRPERKQAVERRPERRARRGATPGSTAPLRNVFTSPSIVRSPSGKEHQHLAEAQARRRRLHGVDEVGVRIDRHDVDRLRAPRHHARLEVLGRADEEDAPERVKGQRGGDEETVEVCLMIRADDERAGRRDVRAARDPQSDQEPEDGNAARAVRRRSPRRAGVLIGSGCRTSAGSGGSAEHGIPRQSVRRCAAGAPEAGA